MINRGCGFESHCSHQYYGSEALMVMYSPLKRGNTDRYRAGLPSYRMSLRLMVKTLPATKQ